ncbi:MAG: exodeoxyribonuclease V subunit gamma, partial [Burkholderiales bacterium]|nr:exodeoxyribonuclease V subunit gamma [Burkholderiales bacterium]
MLLLYQSNRIEVLADALAEAMRAQPAAALVPETVVVQSSAMARWLSFALAERLGVAANVDFRFPASYIWSLFGSVLPEVAPQSPFEPEVLRWTFLRLLEDDEDLPRQPRLAHYLREADARQRYELACRLAEVYDRYLVYRPDWIAAWSEERLLGLGPDEAWQALLWRRAAPEA